MVIAFRTASIVSVVSAFTIGSTIAAEPQPIRTVLIPATVPFAEGAFIPDNIKAECDLPTKQAEWLAQGLRSRGFNVVFQTQDVPDQGAATLQVQISSAFSSGNAFIGHSKGLSISGKLIQNNQQLGNFVAFRKSGGGAFGGFKGSCAVLHRCAKTLGEDVAKWLETPTENAQLGNAR